MRSLIRYVPQEILLDLADADLGHPDGREIIEQHYQQGSRHKPEFSRAHPAFACLKHEDGSNPGLYIQKRSGEFWAVHYEGHACASYRLPAPMSDEHKNMAEYWARAAEAAGYRAELECTLPTGTRPDVLIRGPVMTGIEIQRSAMTRAAAVARSARAQRAGVSDIWCTDSDKRPGWSYRVPTVTANTLPWDVVPPLRSATATSLRVIEAERCTAANFPRCPKTRKRHCGKYHAVHSPWLGLTVDYVAERVPAGEIVPLRFWRSARHQDIILVSHESAALYEELTGSAAGVTYHPAAEERLQDARPGRVECSNPQPAAARKDLTAPSPHAPQNSGAHGRAPGECISCGEPGRLYAGGWLCDRHAPRRTGRWPGP